VRLGRPSDEGEPEDLPDVPPTVFGVKILCGLMLSLNPGLPVKAGDFFLKDHLTLKKRMKIMTRAGPDVRALFFEALHCAGDFPSDSRARFESVLTRSYRVAVLFCFIFVVLCRRMLPNRSLSRNASSPSPPPRRRSSLRSGGGADHRVTSFCDHPERGEEETADRRHVQSLAGGHRGP